MLICLAVLTGLWPCPPTALADSAPKSPYSLQTIDLAVSGRLIQLKSGSALALNPDVSFNVVRASTDAWFDFGLDYRLRSHPSYDLRAPHTLREILGEDKVYHVEAVALDVYKNGLPVGTVSLLVRPSSLDWLRRAQSVEALEDKILCMKKVWELTPGDEMVFQQLLGLLIEAHQYDQAVEMLKAALAEKDDPALQRKLADLYAKQDKPEQALALWSRLLPASPQDAQLLSDMAAAQEQLRRWPQAAESLGRLAGLQRGRLKAATLLRQAKALQLAGQTERAVEATSQAATADPQNVAVWNDLADQMGALGRRGQQLDVLTKAADLHPTDFILQQRLATALLEAGRRDEALAQLERLAAMRPDDAAILLKMARLLDEKKDRKRLTELYDRLGKLRPDDPDINFNLGVLHLDAGRLDQAADKLAVVAKAKPDDLDVQEAYFEALASQKKWDQAAEQAAAMFAANDAAKVAAIVYPGLAANRPDKLAAMLDKALEAKPAAKSLYEMRATLALDREKPREAAKALAKAVEAFPDDLAMAMRLAELYEALGNDAKALALFEKILDKNADYPEAQEHYLQLKTRMLSNSDRKK